MAAVASRQQAAAPCSLGRYDTSFTVAGGEAYKKDDPRAEVHILDAGHFALDSKPNEIIRLTQDFMARQGRK
jgi:pimeloyl-ACP methyl ester carboxylesterase